MNRYNKKSSFQFIVFIIIIVINIICLLQTRSTVGHALTKQEVEKLIKDTINTSPELIISSLETYQMKKYQEINQKSKNLIKDRESELQENSPINNVKDYDITVIEFFDYNCGYCKRANQALNEIVKSDKSIKIVYKELPILGDNSTNIAKIALAVNDIAPDKYIEFHDELMNEKIIDDEVVNKLVNKLKIDSEALKKVQSSDIIIKQLDDNKKIANELGIKGTPAFIINGELIPGALDLQGFKDKIINIRENK